MVNKQKGKTILSKTGYVYFCSISLFASMVLLMFRNTDKYEPLDNGQSRNNLMHFPDLCLIDKCFPFYKETENKDR